MKLGQLFVTGLATATVLLALVPAASASEDPFGAVSCVVNNTTVNTIMVLDSLVYQNLAWPGDFMLHVNNAVFVYGWNGVFGAPACLA